MIEQIIKLLPIILFVISVASEHKTKSEELHDVWHYDLGVARVR